MYKIVLAAISLGLALISMTMSIVFHVWNLRDIKEMFAEEESFTKGNDKRNNSSSGTNTKRV